MNYPTLFGARAISVLEGARAAITGRARPPAEPCVTVGIGTQTGSAGTPRPTRWLQRLVVLLGTLVMLSAPAAGAIDQLKGQPSAFVQSYARGPVAWMPWGEAALARAKTEQKPVLLVIGNFTSELSRAMNRQTFSNQETAAFLNETFVCILVDAKERKDVAGRIEEDPTHKS